MYAAEINIKSEYLEKNNRMFILNSRTDFYSSYEEAKEEVKHDYPYIPLEAFDLKQITKKQDFTHPIAFEYNNFKNKQKEKPELTFILEPWQVIQESSTGIYVQLQKGRRQSRVKINQLQYEKLENGNYEIVTKLGIND